MTRTPLVAILLIAVACGDDAPSGPGTGLIDTFDGITAVETTYPGDAELELDEFGGGPRYAQASVSFLHGNAFIGWYDEDAEYQEVEFAGLDPAGPHTLVVRLSPGWVILELDGMVLGEAAVTLQAHDGELAWGMLPNGVGSELLVEEFRAVPAASGG